MRLKDLTGQRFGRLTVLRRGENASSGEARWKCSCECGKQSEPGGRALRAGLAISCGCDSRARFAAARVKHGQAARGHATIVYGLWKHAKRRAREHGLSFEIALSDIVIPAVCPVFGMPLAPNLVAVGLNSPTLDRIIPSLGYVVGNVAVISMKANRMKSDCTPEQIRALLDYTLGRGLRHERTREGSPEIAA